MPDKKELMMKWARTDSSILPSKYCCFHVLQSSEKPLNKAKGGNGCEGVAPEKFELLEVNEKREMLRPNCKAKRHIKQSPDSSEKECITVQHYCNWLLKT